MTWTYKPDPRGKKYAKHTLDAISSALADYQRGMFFRACSRKNGIPIAVLCGRARNPHNRLLGSIRLLSKAGFLACRVQRVSNERISCHENFTAHPAI